MSSAQLRDAAEAIKDEVCGALCPSQWETAKGRPPHHPKCVALTAALSDETGPNLLDVATALLRWAEHQPGFDKTEWWEAYAAIDRVKAP